MHMYLSVSLALSLYLCFSLALSLALARSLLLSLTLALALCSGSEESLEVPSADWLDHRTANEMR